MNRVSESKGRPQACFLCGDTRHFQRRCPRQFGQHCGRRGHDRRDCYSTTGSNDRSPKHYEASRNDTQSGVVIRVGLNRYSSQVLLDSGAQPSIVDVQLLKAIGLDYNPEEVRYTECVPRQFKLWGSRIARRCGKRGSAEPQIYGT